MSTDNSNNQYLLPLNTKLTIRLKYLDNFQRFLDLPLIDCKIELHLRWSNCVLSKDDDNITGVSFMNTSAKRFVPIVTFSINNNIQFLENIKQRFKRKISWNEYRSEITTQPENNNLDYLTDPAFTDINRLFLLLLKNGNNDPTKDSFDKYYMPLVDI